LTNLGYVNSSTGIKKNQTICLYMNFTVVMHYVIQHVIIVTS